MAEGDDQDESQKTEDPTPKKLQEAKKRGQVPMSREINNWVMMAAATLLIGMTLPGMMSSLTSLMRVYIENAHDLPEMPGGLHVVLGGALIKVLQILAWPFLLLMAAAFLSPFLQVGPIFAPEVIKPDLSKLSPIKGFGRLFSMRAIVEFAKGLLKLLMIGLVGVIILYPYMDKVEHMIGLPMGAVLLELKTLVIKLMIGILVVLMVIAVIDLVYQRQDFMKKMRMSKQELKDEYKQSEGDPHVKGRLRQLRFERARQRMMQAVPTADVVITNPTHFAIALKYDPETMPAPICVAKGMDELALRIREVAKEHDVIIYENPPLARTLFEVVDVDDTIPTEHYKAVAEVISFVFKSKGKL
ncbi:MAG: flagellar biosynthesis protein FlhB [Alphaproteobacteria bacterium]|nr:flagellar biosynthesis protein FlhB [Alphaproteobacteria bacterium]